MLADFLARLRDSEGLHAGFPCPKEEMPERLPAPCWLYPLDYGARGLRLRIDHAADFGLALARFKKLLPEAPSWLHPVIPGRLLRVLLDYRQGRHHLTGVLEEDWLAGFYSVPMRMQAPAEVSPRERAGIERLAGLLEEWPDHPETPLHLLCLATDERLLLIDLHLADSEPAVKLIEERAKESGKAFAALGWFLSHSGRVEAIGGVAESRAIPGIEELRMTVREGDQLGHIVDRATRDRLGYALASGNSRAVALKRLSEVCSAITIQTTAFLD